MKNTHQANNRRTFAFLKDRNIFNGGFGKRGLKDWMTRQEQKREFGDRTRHPKKKK
jgi:hypothetical protein